MLRLSHLIILAKYQASKYSLTIKHFIKRVDFAAAFASAALPSLCSPLGEAQHRPAPRARCSGPGNPSPRLYCRTACRSHLLWGGTTGWFHSLMLLQDSLGANHDTTQEGWSLGYEAPGTSDRQGRGARKLTTPHQCAKKYTHGSRARGWWGQL